MTPPDGSSRPRHRNAHGATGAVIGIGSFFDELGVRLMSWGLPEEEPGV